MKRGRKSIKCCDVNPRNSSSNVEKFKRLTKEILCQMLERTTSKPLAEYYTASVHFDALEMYCSSVPKEHWRNLFMLEFDLVDGKSIYRKYIVDTLSKTKQFDANVVKSNSKSLLNTWFSGKMTTFLKEQKKYQLPLIPSNMDDKHRFLFLTTGFIMKQYANQCAGRKISRRKRKTDLGEELELVYAEAKRQLPNLWTLKLINNEDCTENVFDYSDEEGDETPRENQQLTVPKSPISPNEYYLNVSLETITEEVETKKKKLKLIRAEIKDIQSNHGELTKQYEKLQTERENLQVTQKSLQQRDNFVSYYQAIPDDFFPGQNKGEEIIKLLRPLVALKSVIFEKNITHSPSILLSAWIDSLREKNRETIEEEVGTQLESLEEEENLEETNVSIHGDKSAKKRTNKLPSKYDNIDKLFFPDIIMEATQQPSIAKQTDYENCTEFLKDFTILDDTNSHNWDQIEHVVEEYNPMHPEMSPRNLNDSIYN